MPIHRQSEPHNLYLLNTTIAPYLSGPTLPSYESSPLNVGYALSPCSEISRPTFSSLSVTRSGVKSLTIPRQISEVKNIVSYALNGFKYVPEEESQEWIDTVKGYGWYLDEPDNYRDDGHLFNYGDYDIYDDEVTYDDLKEIMEKKEQCTLYGHYTKIDARDFMDQFYSRCKEKGINIMYVPRHGDIDLRLDDVFTKYEVKDMYLRQA